MGWDSFKGEIHVFIRVATSTCCLGRAGAGSTQIESNFLFGQNLVLLLRFLDTRCGFLMGFRKQSEILCTNFSPFLLLYLRT